MQKTNKERVDLLMVCVWSFFLVLGLINWKIGLVGVVLMGLHALIIALRNLEGF